MVVIVHFLVLILLCGTFGEKCAIVGFQPFSLEEIFHCATCFRERIEDFVLGFKDHSDGNDK